MNTTSTATGSIITSQPAITNGSTGPFLTLADGDTGVRSIVSVEFLSDAGGLMAFVICKPLVAETINSIVFGGVNNIIETNYVQHKMPPAIEDGAYLNYLILVGGNVANVVYTGHIKTMWSE